MIAGTTRIRTPRPRILVVVAIMSAAGFRGTPAIPTPGLPGRDTVGDVTTTGDRR
jgi:hypothetical protein